MNSFFKKVELTENQEVREREERDKRRARGREKGSTSRNSDCGNENGSGSEMGNTSRQDVLVEDNAPNSTGNHNPSPLNLLAPFSEKLRKPF